MKPNRMKNQRQRLTTPGLLFLFLTVLTTSCIGIFKRDKDPEPQLAGVYQISRWNIVVGTLSDDGNSGTVSVTGPTNNRIDFTLNVPGYDAEEFEDLEVRKNGNKNYDIYARDGSTKIGSLNGTDFNFDFQGNNQGQYIRLQITARK